MSIGSLKERVKRLREAHSGDVICTWTDYVRWCYFGRDPTAKWDLSFRKQLEELAEKSGCKI